MQQEIEKKSTHGYQFESSIPVLRMLDEARAKAFYIDYLGFEIDWEHRFEAATTNSPLYMQIHQGDAVIHLNGHAEQDASTSEVRIPVRGLEDYCAYLRAKNADYPKPSVVDPRYKGTNTDMNIFDPFDNYLVFWAFEDSGGA
ncbi:MAG: VOC family protein [Candidatus Latescibacteria bacterium]|mgnify:CR=1 FL=1|jgi:hypothetical protein|nr:VOC family protein [Candidatus Latescibacterota bacterium]